MEYTYDQMFQRNIGIFTPEEQEKIKNLKVAIAGAGGLGGPIAYNLARLGVGEIRLADPDKFEVSNVNRQFGAYIDTIGQFKVDAIKKELSRINPFLVVRTVPEKLNEENIDSFIDGVDFVIDGIDFFAIEDEVTLHQKSREKNLWVFTCQGANNITSFITFSPTGGRLEDFVCVNGKPSVELAIKTMFPILPTGANDEIVKSMTDNSSLGSLRYIPSYSVVAPFNGSFVTEEAIKVIIKKVKPVAVAPELFIFDLKTMRSTFYRNGKPY